MTGSWSYHGVIEQDCTDYVEGSPFVGLYELSTHGQDDGETIIKQDSKKPELISRLANMRNMIDHFGLKARAMDFNLDLGELQSRNAKNLVDTRRRELVYNQDPPSPACCVDAHCFDTLSLVMSRESRHRAL